MPRIGETRVAKCWRCDIYTSQMFRGPVTFRVWRCNRCGAIIRDGASPDGIFQIRKV